MSQNTYPPPVRIDVDGSGNIVVTPLTAPPPPPLPPPPPVQGGTFDSSWNTSNVGGDPSTFGSITISQGILSTKESTIGGNDNSYGYATSQKGSFPWAPNQAPYPNPGLSANATLNSVAVTATSSSRYHAYVGLYYQLSSPVTVNGVTHDWLDTQVRLREHFNGADSPLGRVEMYDAGDSFGYSRVVGGNVLSGFDTEAWFQEVCNGYGIDPAIGHVIAGVEVGTEAFQTQEIDTVWSDFHFSGTISPPPPVTLSASFSKNPATTSFTEMFLAIASGGVSPYSYQWDFGDNTIGAGGSITHAYPSAGNYTVSLTVTDANNTKATSVQVVTVPSTPPPPPPPPVGGVEQIVMVILENTDLSSSLQEPYLSQFASQNALSRAWSFAGHPSEPNYIAIAFGDTFGVNSDGDSTTYPPPTILDLVRASGRTFKVIQNGSRGFDHNGFLLESPDISNTVSGDTPDVIAAVQQGINFVWFTPSDNQNAHDNGIASASQWLSTWIPQLLQAMSSRKSLLIITTDEDSSFVYTVFAGPAAKKGYSSNNPYNHYSFGRLVESLWGGSGLRQCDTANNPSEFLA